MPNASIPSQTLTQTEWFGHPKGLYVCFATELWERFSFYGMKYLLLLYLTKYHLFTDGAAYDVLGAYAGLVYALPVIGGLLADRYLGMRKAVIFGGLLLASGHLLMAWESDPAIAYAAGTQLSAAITLDNGTTLAAGTLLTERVVVQDVPGLQLFFLALALISVGVGFLKPNISTIVGRLYRDDDPRRDSGFTLFYMGINLGAFVAILLCGWLGESFGWHYGFGAAGLGMLIGLVTFLRGQAHLHGMAEPHDTTRLKQAVLPGLSREWAIYLLSLLSLAGVWWLLQREPMVHSLQNALLLIALCGLPLFALLKGTREELHRTLVLMFLIASSVAFWSLFEQTAGSMTLYADRLVEREILGIELRASMFGSLNPLFIILLAPVIAGVWIWLSKHQREPATPMKFALGILLAGLGFGAMVMGAQFPTADGKVAMIWLVLAYLLHTTGELCLSPVGLSAVTKLSIARVVGVTMGTWFLAMALSQTVAARMGKMAAIDTQSVDGTNIAATLATYTELYTYLMGCGIGMAIVVLVASPWLKRGMHGLR